MAWTLVAVPAMFLYWGLLAAIAAYGLRSAEHARRARWVFVPVMLSLCMACCADAVWYFAAAVHSMQAHAGAATARPRPLVYWPGAFVMPSTWLAIALGRKARR